MSKEIKIARTAARGTFHLFVGKIVSRAIGVLGGLILIRLLTRGEYGLLSVAVVAPGILALFSDFGINAAVTKYLAEFKYKGEVDNVKRFIYSGFVFRTALSVGLMFLCYIVADTFAIGAIGKSYAAPLIRTASLFIPAWMLYSFSGSVLVGLDATRGYAALMILNEIFGALLPIMFVVYGMGLSGALLGMAVAYMIAGVVGVLGYVFMVAKMGKGPNLSLGHKVALRKMFAFGIPLAAAGFIGTGLENFYQFMIAAFSEPGDIGNYSIANSAVSLLLYLTFPVSTILFPMFSKINPEKEPRVLRKIYDYSVKYSSFLILPAIALLIVLARPLTLLLFTAEYENSWIYLTFLAIGWLGYGLGRSHLWKLLRAQGDTKLVAKLDTLTAAIAVCLSLVLIPLYGILGLILIFIVVGWPSYIIAVKKAHEKYGISPPFASVGRLYISLAIMVLVLVPLTMTPINEAFKIVIGTLAGVTIYIIASTMTKAMKEGDINALKDIMKPQPLVSAIFNKILKIMERIAKMS